MSRFARFEDSAIKGRLERLRRSEVDLQERVQTRMRQAEAEGRWVPSDPVYQRLSSALRQVRNELRETRAEHQRRAAASIAASVAALKPNTMSCEHRQLFRPEGLPLMRLAEQPAAGLKILGGNEAALTLPCEVLRQVYRDVHITAPTSAAAIW